MIRKEIAAAVTTVVVVEDEMTDPVAGEIVDQQEFAERLLASTKDKDCAPDWAGWVAEPIHEDCVGGVLSQFVGYSLSDPFPEHAGSE